MRKLGNAVSKADAEAKGASKRLTKLEPGEVSVVSRAANRKRFYLMKNEQGTDGEQQPMSKSLESLIQGVEAIAPEDLEAISKAAQTVAIAKADGGDPDARLQTTLRAIGKMLVPYTKAREDGTPAVSMADLAPVLAALGITDADDEEADDEEEAAEEMMNMSVEKGVDGPGCGPGVEKADAALSSIKRPDDVTDAQHEAGKKAAKAAYDEHMAKNGYTETKKAEDDKKSESASTKSEDDMTEKDDVAKSAFAMFPAEQRAALEPIFKAQKEAIAKAEAKAARLEETLLRKELVAKAEGYRHLGVETAELAEHLYEMQTRHPEGMPKFEKLLKSLDAQAKRGGLFNEVGSQASNSNGGSAAEMLDSQVASIVAKSDGRSKAQVYRDFVKTPEGAELYKAYQAEQRRAQREV